MAIKDLSVAPSLGTHLLNRDVGDARYATTAAGASGFKNVIHNGCGTIAQRGASVTGITGTAYTLDRWMMVASALGTWQIDQVADAPTDCPATTSIRCYLLSGAESPNPGTSTDLAVLIQRFEGINLAHFMKGKAGAVPFTLSFRVKSTTTGTYIAMLFDTINGRHCSKSYTVNVANTWETKSITFPADTTGAFTATSVYSMQLSLWLAAGSAYKSGSLATTWATYSDANTAVGQVNLAAANNNNISFTAVQLEAGSVATPYEQRPIDVELDLCQRYYQQFGGQALYQVYGFGMMGSTTAAVVNIKLLKPMRTIPTYAANAPTRLVDYAGAYTITATAMAANECTNDNILMTITVGGGGLTAYRPCYWTANNSLAAWIAFSADL